VEARTPYLEQEVPQRRVRVSEPDRAGLRFLAGRIQTQAFAIVTPWDAAPWSQVAGGRLYLIGGALDLEAPVSSVASLGDGGTERGLEMQRHGDLPVRLTAMGLARDAFGSVCFMGGGFFSGGRGGGIGGGGGPVHWR
jgi:hypothetical protein